MGQNPLERQRKERRVALVVCAAFLLAAAVIQAVRGALPSAAGLPHNQPRPPITKFQP